VSDTGTKKAAKLLPWILFCVAFGSALLVAIGTGVGWWHGRSDQGATRWSNVAIPPPDWMYEQLSPPAQIRQAIEPKPVDLQQAHVSVYSFPAVKAPPATLRDLADSGQAHAIDFLAKNTKQEPHTWRDLQEALTNANSAAAAEKDPFKFERVVVSTVTRGAAWEPGDRMVWARIFVRPINFEFGDYAVVATQNATDKIASVEASRSRKISADLSLAIPGIEGSKADFAPSDERTVKTTKDISSQYEKLGIDITPGHLRIIRESDAGDDVLGNVLVPLSMVTDPATIMKTFPEDTRPESKSENLVLLVTGTHLSDGAEDLDVKHEGGATITVRPQTPLPHCPLLARVWMLYELRNITKHREFVDEGQQDVTLLRKANDQKDVEIVPADDVSPAIWHIRLIPQAKNTPPCTADTGTADESSGQAALMLQGHADENSPLRDIVFSDYGQASAFAHWVRYKYECKTKISGLMLNYPPGASLVAVKMTDNECDQKGKTARTAATYRAKVTKE